MRGVGRAIFAATLLLIAGTVNIVYGIGALDNANIFRNGQRFVFTNLNTMGWVLIILGIIRVSSPFGGEPRGPRAPTPWSRPPAPAGIPAAQRSRSAGQATRSAALRRDPRRRAPRQLVA